MIWAGHPNEVEYTRFYLKSYHSFDNLSICDISCVERVEKKFEHGFFWIGKFLSKVCPIFSYEMKSVVEANMLLKQCRIIGVSAFPDKFQNLYSLILN